MATNTETNRFYHLLTWKFWFRLMLTAFLHTYMRLCYCGPRYFALLFKIEDLHYLMLERCVRIYEARILVQTDTAFFIEFPLFFGVCAETSGCFCEVLSREVFISSIKPILTSNENLFVGVFRGPYHDAVTGSPFCCTWIPS